MKRSVLLISALLMLFPCIVNAQDSKIQVLYKLLETNSKHTFSLDEGTALGVIKGATGNIYRPFHESENGNAKAEIVGEYEVVKVSEFVSEVTVTLTGEHFNTLYAEFAIAPYNLHYQSVVSQLVSKGVVFTDGYGEVILNFDDRESSALSEYLRIIELSESAKVVAENLKEDMEDIPVESGRFAGRTMFDVMENSTYEDVYSFLIYANEHWKLYFGNTWMFAEVYATWLTSEFAKKENSLVSGEPSLGLSLQRDFEYSNFPVIAELNPGYWSGIDADFIKPTTLITHVNGESMFNKTAEQALIAIGSEEGSIVEIEFFADGVFESYSLPVLKVPAYSSTVTLEDLDLESPTIYPVIKNGKWGLIDGEGNYILEPKCDNLNSTFFSFSNGLAEIEVDGKKGFVNILGEEIIPPQYKDCRAFSEGLAAIIEKEDESAFAREYLVGFIDIEGNRVSTLNYEIPSLFTGEYHGGLCMISKYEDGEFKKGYLNKKGELVIPMKYYKAEWFRNGIAIVREEEDKKDGIIDTKGNYVLSPSYDYINDFNEGEALAHIEDHYWLIDTKGNRLLDFKEYRPSTFGGYTHDLFLIYTTDKMMGLMNRKGEMVIEPKYMSINGLSNNLMSASLDTKKMEEGHWFFIDKNGNTAIEGPFQETSFFSEGACWVKQNDKWGLIDAEGNWLIEPITSFRPGPFKGPLARINTGDFMNPNYLYVDRKGTIVYNPK